MYAVGRLSSYISQGVYTVSAPFHPFGGAVDIIVVEQPDGSFKSSPWYVKFGKFQGVLKTREKIVNISINGVDTDFLMYLDHKGEAYFLREVEVEGEEIDSTIFSPPSSGDETDEQSGSGRTVRTESSKNYDFSVEQPNLISPVEFDSGKIMVRSNSRRSRIFGLVFGRKAVKEINKQEEGGGVDMERATSLERAEIAVDLMDVKWSTNIPTDIARRENISRLSDQSMLVEESNEDLQVSASGLLVHDNVENYFDQSFEQEATVFCNGEMGNSSGSGIADIECSNGVHTPVQSIRPEEQDRDSPISQRSARGDNFEAIPETSRMISKFELGNGNFNNREESEVVITFPILQSAQMGKVDLGPCMQNDEEGKSDERVSFSSSGAPNGENEVLFEYCEASQKSRLDLDGEGCETLNLSQGKGKEAHFHAGVQCDSEKLVQKVNLQPISAALTSKDNPSHLKSPGNDFDKFQNTNASFRCDGNSSFREDRDTGVLEAHSSFKIQLVTSESGETEILELIHQETITERHNGMKNLQTRLFEACANDSQVNGFSYPCVTRGLELSLDESSPVSRSCAQTGSTNLVHLVDEEETQVACSSSSRRDIISQEEEDLAEEEMHRHNSIDFVDGPQGSNTDFGRLSNLRLEGSGEDQFIFGDIDGFMNSGTSCQNSALSDSSEIDDSPSVTMNYIEDLNESSNMDHRSNVSTVKTIQDYSPSAFESLLEESTPKSSPMSIPRSRKHADEEIDLTIESLPNFRSHIDDLEIPDVFHHLSHSLDSHSEKLRHEMLLKDVSSSAESGLDTKHLVEDDPIKDARFWEKFKNMSATNSVEISLCKQLLYEGMGSDAAAQVFDAEKVDVENWVSLGPELVKNDNLIVRIGGRYFPWEAAASYVLEMISLSHGQNIEAKGMIAVDSVEKTIEGEPAKDDLPSGGSWTIWPFSRRRSRTMSPVQPPPDNTNISDVVSVSEKLCDDTGNNTSPIVKVSRQKVKSIVPTSEELASLNLKEGKNVITFTFSTAMLGKQQVDARIYLWKWNTRIVVSDVDGTITRSDVLGQFMPLVGKDWSHIGVTHLFSAIKENGYQLLFLSARAISQAYLTRQFLFNLKQDGKALPDGPVVISPDGLFPSLFREVIRRAPHEFKIACLQDIRALFPPDCSPFYAGFGNRITDEISYRKLGIPKGKIFIINAKGEVAVNRRFDRKSYTSLHALVDDMFPATISSEQEDFNSWNFWKVPLPDIST